MGKTKAGIGFIIYFFIYTSLLIAEKEHLTITPMGGSMAMPKFFPAVIGMLSLFLFLICDLLMHKRSFRILALSGQIVFLLWSIHLYVRYRSIDFNLYYGTAENMFLSYRGREDRFYLPGYETFQFVWSVSAGVMLYLLLAILVSYLWKKWRNQ